VTLSKKTGKIPLGPIVSFKEEEAGRETMAAIAEDRMELVFAHRGQTSTKHYGDRISNAPGAMSPKIAGAIDDAPEISVCFEGAETSPSEIPDSRSPDSFASHIEVQIEPEITSGDSSTLDLRNVLIQKTHTFLLDCPPEALSSDEVRRALVAQRIIRQLPFCSLDDIGKIEVRSGRKSGTSMMRVWVRVP
jgi:hypothetical protein